MDEETDVQVEVTIRFGSVYCIARDGGGERRMSADSVPKPTSRRRAPD